MSKRHQMELSVAADHEGAVLERVLRALAVARLGGVDASVTWGPKLWPQIRISAECIDATLLQNLARLVVDRANNVPDFDPRACLNSPPIIEGDPR